MAVALALVPSAYSQTCESPQTIQAALATVEGQPVFLRQASPAIEGQLARLRQAQFELESMALDDVIAKHLLANEAKRNGLTVEQLLKREVDAKISKPTSEEVKAYELGRSAENTEEQAAAGDSLWKAKIKIAREQFAQHLRIRTQVAILIQPPTMTLSCDPARMRGSHDAPINIIEFSDFSCPYCKRVEQTLTQVITHYGADVNLYYRDFPLVQIHPNAKSAAEAARCALDQHKFWEYHDLLFASSTGLELEELVNEARQARLDEHEFVTCLMSARHRAEVESDINEGMRAGVQTTPAFFINGAYLSGAQPTEAFEKIIDRELGDLRLKQVRPHN